MGLLHRGWGVRRRVRRVLRNASPQGLRARRWTARALAAVRTDLAGTGMGARCTDFPVDLPDWSRPVVEHSLERADATCLQRCLVLQAWFAARGREVEIVVAVPHSTEDAFSAHAWIRGYDRDEHDRYRELTVLAPLGAVPGRVRR